MFSHNTCSWCLQSHCGGSSCTPPEEPLFFTQTNNAFCDEILPSVKNAKLELPVDSNEPLSPEQFHFEDSYWGNQYGYPNDLTEQYAYIYDVNNDNDVNQQHYPQQQWAASGLGPASITRQPTSNHTTILSSRNHFRIMKMVMARTPENDSC